jgi:hypothetical protein
MSLSRGTYLGPFEIAFTATRRRGSASWRRQVWIGRFHFLQARGLFGAFYGTGSSRTPFTTAGSYR